jgi:mannose-6-phosphate isomerase-like protein (cupin superfamily)
MLKAVRRTEAQVHHLPGRDWLFYVGPESTDARHLTVGYSVFPPNSAPPGHTHLAEEEVVYVVAGRGELVSPEGSVALEPGTAVYIPAGTHHATVSHGPDQLELVTSFSPALVPGSWDRHVGPDLGNDKDA